MPRKLPWLQKRGSSTAVSRRKRPFSASKPPKKRVKVSDPTFNPDEEEASESSNREGAKDKAPTPSSPPPEPPSERFMDEGIDRDDKYRMVEDEFLSIAQQFTVHLHAAEYKRQQKKVKVRNAETINSISRPVSGKMPNHTKRKVESVARSKAQRKKLESVLGKDSGEADDFDESDGDGLPYLGTTLHGLMDSLKGKSRSLAAIRSPGAATRAAAGFQRPAAQSKDSQNVRSRSPMAIAALRLGLPNSENDGAMESSDDDDDLDAPAQAPRLPSFGQRTASIQSRLEDSRSSESKAAPSFTTSRLPFNTASTKKFVSEDLLPRPEPVSPQVSRVELESKARITRRLEKVRLQRAKQEKEVQERKNLDIIPTFL